MREEQCRNGEKIGKLTPLKYWGKNKRGQKKWLFKCDCGRESIGALCNISENYVNCCIICSRRKHMSADGDTMKTSKYWRLYKIWESMRSRCNNKNNPRYPTWGGRGIKVCQKWNDNYRDFKEWALKNGYDYNLTRTEQSLDRIDVDGDYCPENCRWINAEQQASNRRNNIIVEYKSKKYTMTQLAKKFNIKTPYVIKRRWEKGLRDEELVTPAKQELFVEGKYLTVMELSKKYGVDSSVIWARIGRGDTGLRLVRKKGETWTKNN